MAMGDQASTQIMEFIQRYRSYEESRDSTHAFIRDLMIFVERLENHLRTESREQNQKVRELSMDLEAAIDSRRAMQQHVQDLEEKIGLLMLGNNNMIKDQVPYVSVLIDGNGLIFQSEFLKQGAEGGRRAAMELHRALVGDPLVRGDTGEIIVKVFADMKKLNKVLQIDGSVNSETTLSDFVAGFNQALFFEFVDVGSQKDRAIAKLQEQVIFHMRSPNCQRVVVGVSHDAAYGPVLEDILRMDLNKQDLLAVLEGTPTVRAIATLGLDIIRFKAIFRSDSLVDRRTISTSSAQSRLSGDSASTATSERPAAAAAVSYATVTRKATPPPQITLPIPLAPKNTNSAGRAVKQPAKPTWNPGPRGLDTPIPINPTALDTIKKRKDNNKLCNNHFLRGPCAKGDGCCFVHDYTPNKDEKNAIAFLARLNPCTNGQECDVENCIYGHHCPSVVNGICTHPFCKFGPEDHPPGTKLRSATPKP
ncbi:C-x8-C-x5-C-x3-H type zinc finger protein-like protein [Xylariaceae sp. FL0594]|nr:C-x8-C-x5-C-x3-H type zinc finger protein-like protein [Xylariaceae sp. FL0594]